MTQRDRQVLLILGGCAAAVLAVVFIVYTYVWAPLQEYNRTIADLENEVNQKETAVLMVQVEKKRVEKYRALSLPASPDHAASEYSKWLHPVLQFCGLRDITLTGPPPAALRPPPASQQGKKAGHMTLTFHVRAKGDLATVVRTLDVLKKAPVLHRVRGLTLSQGDEKSAGRLNLQLTLEAMIVNKAAATQPFLSSPDLRLVALDSIAGLQRGPVGLALAPWLAAKKAITQRVAGEQLARNYPDIARKDIFVGALPEAPQFTGEGLDVLQFIHLVQTNPTAKEAFLRNRAVRQRELRLRAVPGSGYDVFRIMDEEGDRQVIRAKVLRVEQREIYFQVEDAVYELHIGYDLAEAMRRPLSEGRMEDLELVIDEDFAAEAAGGAPARKTIKGSKGNFNKGGKGQKGFGGFKMPMR
jgi:hypothetical protein